MKKFIAGAVLSACLLTAPFLVACDDKPSDKKPEACTHEWVETDSTDATCTSVGTVDWECSVCGETKQTKVEMLAHTPKADYEHDGNEHWKLCSVCDGEIPSTREAHSGGTATYTHKAECAKCETAYGELLTTDIIMSDFGIAANGRFVQHNERSIKSAQPDSLIVKRDGQFVLGELSAVVKLNGVASDNGIVFGVTNPDDLSKFWESGVSYYFFFVSRNGTAYLGKVTAGSWSVCGEAPIQGFDSNGEYELKVVRSESGVKCYVDNVLYVNYGEVIMLEGTGYGLRAGAAGVIYSELYCDSYGKLPELETGNLEVVTGGTAGTDDLAITTANNTLAFIGKEMTVGTYSLDMTAFNDGSAGITFGMSDDGKSYYLFSVSGKARRVELKQRKNGTTVTLYSNYLSAGYSASATYEMKVVLKDGTAYAYFNDILYTVHDVEPNGDKLGIYAEKSGSQFAGFTVTETATVDTCDTLLFGHSYFELWEDWRTDLAAVEGLGKYHNIGIGGSIAAHWNKMKDSILAYSPSKAIFMIGINDLTGGVSPTLIAGNVRSLIGELHEELPELQVVLLSVNYCPAREQFRSEIVKTNELYKNICASDDRIYYAEVLTAFCDDGDTPASRWFKDDLHPSAEGYTQKIVPAIISALNGEDQPTLSAEDEAAAFEKAKSVKLCELSGYDVDAFAGSAAQTAKTIYDSAVAAINACTTKEELDALDLSDYIDELKELPSIADSLFAAIKSSDDCSVYETNVAKSVFDASADGKIELNDYGYRIYNGIQAADMSFTFKLSDLVGEYGTVGVLFRATQTATKGVNGYLINFVTEANYLQVYYLDGGYGDAGSHNIVKYIGGWVFPDEVEDTLFRAIVKNDTVYIYTEADYVKLGEDGYGCSVPLNGSNERLSLPVYVRGGIGVISWWPGATATIEIDKVSVLLPEALAAAKDARKAELAFSEADYYDAGLTAANAIYAQAAAAIDACTTRDELSALDLSEYVAQLGNIPTKSNIDGKKNVFADYGDNAFDGENIAAAQAVRANAYDALEACITTDALDDIDLAGYLAQLKAIPSKTDALCAALKGNTDISAFELDPFVNAIKNSTDNTFDLCSIGHRIYNGTQAADMSFTFKLHDVSGSINSAGILFRATQNATLGVSGYLINFETENNFLQVFYLDEGYSASGKNVVTYIGGWVFPDEVEDTLFRAVVKNDTLYLYTEAGYAEQGALAPHIEIALDGSSMGLELSAYQSGAVGLLMWNDGSTAKLTIDKLNLVPLETQAD